MSTSSNSRRVNGDGIVIAGGGLAGQRCAETLRRAGYERPIRLVCSEPHRPYDRPPLSKELLTDAEHDGELPFRPDRLVPRAAVDLLLGVERERPGAHRAPGELSDGSALRYDQLLIATGGRPADALRSSPATTTCRCCARSTTPALLREVLASRARLAVIGAGFIGLEVAATARRLGVEVTLDRGGRVPADGRARAAARRLVCAPARGRRRRRPHGRDRRPRRGQRRRPRAAPVRRLGRRPSTTSWSAPGSTPTSAGWPAAGSTPRAASPVDAHGRTAIEDVFAAGDAAATFDASSRRHVPGSHWEAAGRQGARAARAMLGLDPGAAPADELLDRPVRPADPVRRPARGPPTRSRSTAIRRAATSPPSSPAPAGQSPRCSSTGLVPYPRLAN